MSVVLPGCHVLSLPKEDDFRTFCYTQLMENQPVQPTTPQTSAPQPIPPEIPPVIPVKKISKPLIVVFVLFFLTATGAAGYFAYKNYQTRQFVYQNYQPKQQPVQDQGTTQSPDIATENVCDLKPDPGSCTAYIQSFYYDQKEKKCKEFIWGGCEGVRPFETLKECQSTCQSKSWKVFKSNVILFQVEAPSDWEITESVIPSENNQKTVTISSLDFRYEGSEVAEGFALKIGPINDGMEKIESVEQFTSDHPKTFEETEENKKDRYRGLVVVINGILWARYSTSAHTLYDNIPLDVSLLSNPKQIEDARILFGQILSTFKFTKDQKILQLDSTIAEYQGDGAQISSNYNNYVWFKSCNQETSHCNHYFLSKNKLAEFPSLQNISKGTKVIISGKTKSLDFETGYDYFELGSDIKIELQQ